MSNTLSVSFVQANSHVGDIGKNKQKVIDVLRSNKSDLVVFPECFLTGYPLQDLVVRPGFLSKVEAALDELAEAVKEIGGPALLIGAPIAGTELPYNAAILISLDGSRQTAIKTELPNNDVFDERRTFARGSNPLPLTLYGWKLGVMICEDMWHGQVARQLADEGADLLISMNGSPMEIDKHNVRQRHAARRVHDTGLSIVYLNLVGGQDELVFDGGSFFLDHEQKCHFMIPHDETVFQINYSRKDDISTYLDYEVIVDKNLSMNSYGYHEQIYRALVVGMRDYVAKNGFNEVILGLSGGLDSAIVSTIAMDALGPEKVTTLMLPAQWTGEESRSLADEMAIRCGFNYSTIPVSPITDALEEATRSALVALGQPVNDHGMKVALENIQARARGNVIMAISNARPGSLVLSTGNKSEMSVGYATLYGDMCGGFNPIKDLYKTQVQALSSWRNSLNNDAINEFGLLGCINPIPDRIITRPPTAELSESQTDEEALGSYRVLDFVLFCLIEQKLDAEMASRMATKELGQDVSLEYTTRIAKLVKNAEYKRRQAPPGIKVSGRSFGFGWRYPITNGGTL